MEKIFFVKNDDLEEINKVLAKGGKVKMISTIADSIDMIAFQVLCKLKI